MDLRSCGFSSRQVEVIPAGRPKAYEMGVAGSRWRSSVRVRKWLSRHSASQLLPASKCWIPAASLLCEKLGREVAFHSVGKDSHGGWIVSGVTFD